MSQPDDKFRKISKTVSEEKTSTSESIETNDTPTGQIEKRTTLTETFERRTRHTEIFESGSQRIEHSVSEVSPQPIEHKAELAAEQPKIEAAAGVPAVIDSRAKVEPTGIDPPVPPPAGWSQAMPDRLKFLLRGCVPAIGNEAVNNATDLDGDFLLDAVFRHDRSCVWELTFPATAGFYKAVVSCRPLNRIFQWSAKLDGVDGGPLWQGISSDPAPAEMALSLAEAPTASGVNWPKEIRLKKLKVTHASAAPSNSPEFFTVQRLEGEQDLSPGSEEPPVGATPIKPMKPVCGEGQAGVQFVAPLTPAPVSMLEFAGDDVGGGNGPAGAGGCGPEEDPEKAERDKKAKEMEEKEKRRKEIRKQKEEEARKKMEDAKKRRLQNKGKGGGGINGGGGWGGGSGGGILAPGASNPGLAGIGGMLGSGPVTGGLDGVPNQTCP